MTSSKTHLQRAIRVCVLILSLVASSDQTLAGFLPRTITSFNPTFGNGQIPGGSLIQGTNGDVYVIGEFSGAFGLGAIYQIAPGGVLSVLTSFPSMVASGTPFGNLIQGADGNFYGTGTSGGTNSNGALFQVTASGALTTIASFAGSTGAGPGTLMQAANGNFYGMSPQGGTNSAGTIYQVTPAGAVNLLYTFTGGLDGGNPESPLVQGTNGALFGTTTMGGTNGNGTFFAISTSGQFTNLVSFASNSSPSGRLAEGVDGNFYGTTLQGGVSNFGVGFKITPAGELTILNSFTGSNGSTCETGLVVGSDGNFYGATSSGGEYGLGTLFRMVPAGYIATLHSFDGKDGVNPASLTPGMNGNFYGTTASTVFRMAPSGAVFTLVVPGGSSPRRLIRGTDNHFYGVTAWGGDSGDGTVFKVSSLGAFTKLSSFDNTNDGAEPGQALIEAGNGEFYGTAYQGGIGDGGTIFRMAHNGRMTTLVSFNQDPSLDAQGANPTSLIQGADGNFYGTTYRGGSAQAGTVFKMTPQGGLTTLTSFQGNNGANPSVLIQGSDHNFYGITQAKLPGPQNPQATAFEMSPAGQVTTLFTFNANSGTPPESFIQGTDGNFYGTTGGNGSNIEATIFRLTPSGVFTNLAEFDATNGLYLNDLVEGPDGHLYCAASFDGSTNVNQGAIYRVTPAGRVLRLLAFSGAEGCNPATLLTQPGDRLLGVASSGGVRGGGTVFTLEPASYQGLFYETTNINPSSSGFFQMTMALDLTFTGTLKINGENHPISGTFDNATLSATMRIGRPGLPILTVNFQLSPSGDAITGTVSDGAWTAQLSGGSADYQLSNPAPQAGRYSFSLGSANGAGLGRLTATADGTVTFAGSLSDRSAISENTVLESNGQWPLYVSLYHGKGSLIGWVTFTNQPTSQLAGTITWSKLNGAGPRGAQGFTNTMTIQGTLIAP